MRWMTNAFILCRVATTKRSQAGNRLIARTPRRRRRSCRLRREKKSLFFFFFIFPRPTYVRSICRSVGQMIDCRRVSFAIAHYYSRDRHKAQNICLRTSRFSICTRPAETVIPIYVQADELLYSAKKDFPVCVYNILK